MSGRRLPAWAILFVYLVLGAWYTWPLLRLRTTHIAGGSGDPLLNAAILWWNATTLPLTDHWWNPPYFYLTRDVASFTENLLGISPIASPIYWITGNPLTAYNIALYVTWPLSAFGVYLLVLSLTSRRDAAFLAGLAYGFTPYRMSEYGHIQMVSSYGLPFMLLGLHRYLDDSRKRWLVLFGVAWLVQSLANGYLMFFGAVLIAFWLVFFCLTFDRWRVGLAILGTWVIASLPLVPILLRYREAHAVYALRRSFSDPLSMSVGLGTWLQVTRTISFWSRFLPEGSDSHFPGATSLVIVAVALALLIRLRRPGRRGGLALLTLGSLVAILFMYIRGPWMLTIGETTLFKMTTYSRAVILGGVCGVAWLWLTIRRDNINRRSAFFFYVLATILMGIFAMGPAIQVGSRLVQAPYAWLMYVPGFTELRVPMRFWMVGVLCLSVSVGFAVSRLPVSRRRLRAAVFVCSTAGFLLDGWIREMPMGDAQILWPVVEPADTSVPGRPIIELPLGPDWDSQATFRSIAHRRPVVNGVSGYDPEHYAPLQEGLNTHDPEMLRALRSYGSIDVVVNGDDDPDGRWARYASSVPGASPVATDGHRTVFRLPAVQWKEEPLGASIPIKTVATFAADDARAAIDGRMDTEWRNIPQRPEQWVVFDLGEIGTVGGVTHALGEFARDFPRELAIDLSTDGSTWAEVWRGRTVAMAFRAAVVGPIDAVMKFTFEPRPARYVRLRQLAAHRNFWRISEFHAYAPPTGVSSVAP